MCRIIYILVFLFSVSTAWAEATWPQWDAPVQHNQIFTLEQFTRAPYIVQANYQTQQKTTDVDFWVRGLTLPIDTPIVVLHKQQSLFDPDTRSMIGLQVTQVGQGKIIQAGEPALIRLSEVTTAIMPGDRVEALTTASLPNEPAQIPTHPVRAQVIAQLSPGTISSGSLVILNYGAEQGAVAGDKLLLSQPRFMLKTNTGDPTQHQSIGELVILRVFDQTCYAGVVNTKTPIDLLTRVRTP